MGSTLTLADIPVIAPGVSSRKRSAVSLDDFTREILRESSAASEGHLVKRIKVHDSTDAELVQGALSHVMVV